LSTNNKRPIYPIILIAAGLLILVGAVAGLVLLSGTDDPPQVSNPDQEIPFPKVARVSLTTAKGAFDDGAAVFVDVRDQAYYENGHIPGARSIPLNQIETRLSELDPGDWIILYCT
jgi:3-mercaptopyruvate sulfurtransferase SseA